MITLLGLDPGFAALGYAIVNLGPVAESVPEVGVVQTQPAQRKKKVLASEDNLVRARELFDALRDVRFRHKPQVICTESMSWPRNASSVAKIGISWGVIAALSALFDLSVVQASPQQIKKRLCGRKDASKEEVETAIVNLYPNVPDLVAKGPFPRGQREHVYDALGAIVTGLDSEVVRALRKTLVR